MEKFQENAGRVLEPTCTFGAEYERCLFCDKEENIMNLMIKMKNDKKKYIHFDCWIKEMVIEEVKKISEENKC